MSATTKLELHLPDAEDSEKRAELARSLREELLELHDIAGADLVRSSAVPAGAKGDAVMLGTILVTLAASGGVLTTLINSVQSWLTRNDRHSVTVEMGGDKLTITGSSSAEQTRLLDAWIERHKITS